ncbi:hypothetical protein [Streptomyces sp. NPDC004629]|uniref:hypothetical protein n=1 Tax=Streptomyces sp. NPDC004629 TaxID=3364705 RepID=UPI003685E6D3
MAGVGGRREVVLPVDDGDVQPGYRMGEQLVDVLAWLCCSMQQQITASHTPKALDAIQIHGIRRMRGMKVLSV